MKYIQYKFVLTVSSKRFYYAVGGAGIGIGAPVTFICGGLHPIAVFSGH